MLFNSVTSAGVLCLLSGTVFAQPQTQPQPAFTYLSGPDFCTVQYGYAVPAFCAAPGELPLGSFPVPGINASYIDPNFGAKVTIIIDRNHDPTRRARHILSYSGSDGG